VKNEAVKTQTSQIKERAITAREVQILHFINEFGFCEMPYIQRQFGLKKARSYQLITRLIDMGLVLHERVFHSRHGLYRLTKKGAAYTQLPELAKVPVGNYEHQLMIIDVYLKLKSLYPDATWISERKLEHDKFSAGLGQRGHLADGILVMPDQTKMAIEVELTQKGKNRLGQILKGYSSQFDFTEVWYYCVPEIIPSYKAITARLSYIKIFNLREFLA
jgi:hypothetical protein